jgi:co-chaperonin GroES (HSP10)
MEQELQIGTSLGSMLDAEFKRMEAADVSAFQDRETRQELPIEGGFAPANNKVVVLPDPIMRQSAGGIALPDELIYKEEMAQIFATLVAIGPDAWADSKTPAAEIGDRVMIAKFTGQLFTGPDNRRYRVIHDLDIIGRITTEGVRK